MRHLIEIENEQKSAPPFRGYKTALRGAVAKTLEVTGFPHRARIGITLVEPEEIRRLNREFRDVDRETDVLSFPQLEPEEVFEAEPFCGAVILGDVILCPRVIREQSLRFETTYRQELCLMTIHSILHLLGWDHVEEKEKKEMYALQESILSALGEGEVKTEGKE